MTCSMISLMKAGVWWRFKVWAVGVLRIKMLSGVVGGGTKLSGAGHRT